MVVRLQKSAEVEQQKQQQQLEQILVTTLMEQMQEVI
jgi:hypothetical protein